LGRPAFYLRHQIYHDRNRGYADDEQCRVCAFLTPVLHPPVPKKIENDMDYNSPFNTTGFQQIQVPQNTSPCGLPGKH
jgi:hypothetical protein